MLCKIGLHKPLLRYMVAPYNEGTVGLTCSHCGRVFSVVSPFPKVQLEPAPSLRASLAEDYTTFLNLTPGVEYSDLGSLGLPEQQAKLDRLVLAIIQQYREITVHYILVHLRAHGVPGADMHMQWLGDSLLRLYKAGMVQPGEGEDFDRIWKAV